MEVNKVQIYTSIMYGIYCLELALLINNGAGQEEKIGARLAMILVPLPLVGRVYGWW